MNICRFNGDEYAVFQSPSNYSYNFLQVTIVCFVHCIQMKLGFMYAIYALDVKLHFKEQEDVYLYITIQFTSRLVAHEGKALVTQANWFVKPLHKLTCSALFCHLAPPTCFFKPFAVSLC